MKMRLLLLIISLLPLYVYAQERPGPDNSGPLVDESQLVEYTGRSTIRTDNTVIEGVIINGTLNIEADNVTLRNFVIRSEGIYGINVRSGTGHLFEDGLIYGPTSAAILGGDFTARRLEIMPALDDSTSDNYDFIYSGYTDVPDNGVYTFYTTSDDGSDLFIGNQKVVDNDGSHGEQERSGEIGLQAGLHPITVRYFQGLAAFGFELAWQGPGFAKQVIPSHVWFTESSN